MRLLKATIISLFLFSCNQDHEMALQDARVQMANRDIQELERYLQYYKDDSTNLCFAAECISCHSAIFTNVPCDHVPESKLHHFKSR